MCCCGVMCECVRLCIVIMRECVVLFVVVVVVLCVSVWL